MATLTYQGHGSFRLRSDDGTVIYVDPFAGNGYDLPADIILVTHDHYDHMALHKVTKKPDCELLTFNEMLKNGEYLSEMVKGVSVRAVEAYNAHHEKDRCVGFIITVDGIKIYAAGDTSRTKMMETFAPLQLDYALLCGDGIYNMDIPEAIECAKLIQAKHTIPIHLKPGALFDEERAAAFDCPGRLVVRPGEEIIL